MTVAAETREAVRQRPFLETALRAGVLNYTAAARFLDERAGGSAGDQEAVAAALRRYREELDDYEAPNRRASVSMKSGVSRVGGESDAVTTSASDAATSAEADPLLVVGDVAFTASGGDLTAVVAEGDLEAGALADVLGRLRTAEVEVEAAASAEGTLAVVVDRRAGADAVRAVEDAL